MKNTGRKKLRGIDFNRVPDKNLLDKGDLMVCLGYTRKNTSSFYRLRDRDQIPEHKMICGAIYFPRDKAIKFYIGTSPRASKPVLEHSTNG